MKPSSVVGSHCTLTHTIGSMFQPVAFAEEWNESLLRNNALHICIIAEGTGRVWGRLLTATFSHTRRTLDIPEDY